MTTIKTFIDYQKENIPKELYDKTYKYFSFDVYRDQPIALILGAMDDNEKHLIYISGLNAKKPRQNQQVTSFLKSIVIDNTRPAHPLSMDLKIARAVYGVDIPVIKSM